MCSCSRSASGLVGVSSASATFATQGERIAFFRTPAGESDTELFTIELDGTGAQRLTHNDIDEYDPRISADGSKIVFWAIPGDGTDSELYTIWSDGTHRRRLTDDDVLRRHRDLVAYRWPDRVGQRAGEATRKTSSRCIRTGPTSSG